MSLLGFSLFSLQANSYIDVAFLTLVIYDTAINLDMEYCHIWKSKWSLVKALYLWTRYMPFIDLAAVVTRRIDIAINMDPSACSKSSEFITIFSGFNIGIAETILMIRTYALYGRSRKLLIFFVFMWLSIGGFALWDLSKNWAAHSASATSATSCDLKSDTHNTLMPYVILFIAETVIVSLTLWKAFFSFHRCIHIYRPTTLIISFYRDGVLFYLVMLGSISVSRRHTYESPTLYDGLSSGDSRSCCCTRG
ncbi:hypothetical protein R3P38DRAFT_943611 [Favolaschia claudopus]|uniref:DUF6533 domain-containing protein n=1 Tax=Favolaschia claudopus TaxID=2862362 RepID=A0AAW0BML9_9AGAR